MAAVIANESKPNLILKRHEGFSEDGLLFGLFTGATIPDEDTVIGDLTEVTGDGYGQDNVGGFSAPFMTVDNHAKIVSDIVSFTNSGVGDWDEATGWFVKNNNTGLLLIADRFDTPFTLGSGETKVFQFFWQTTTEVPV